MKIEPVIFTIHGALAEITGAIVTFLGRNPDEKGRKYHNYGRFHRKAPETLIFTG